jgi:amino acid adenylation domain-containing protein
VGIHDNFFELGGHSLLAAQVISRMEPICGKPVSIRTLFENPTVASLLETMELQPSTESIVHAPKPASRTRRAPLSFVQERIWFIQQLEGGHQFHMPMVFRLRGALDKAALEVALRRIVERHDVFRTTFFEEDGRPVQNLQESVDFTLSQGDLAEVDPDNADDEINRVVQAILAKPFQLDRAPLFRCRLLRIRDNDHVFVLVLHHLIADGWSVQLLSKELDLFYRNATTGLPLRLPDLGPGYLEFSQNQREMLKGKRLDDLKAYWLSILDDAPVLSTLPPDHERTSGGSRVSGNFATKLDPGVSSSLRHFCAREGVTLFSFMLSAFRLLLARHSGQDDLVIGTPVLGRKHEDLENLIGCFLGTIPLRTRIRQDASFRETLKQVQSANLDAFAHEDLPFEQLVETVRPERSLSHAPLFQVLFNLFNDTRAQFALGDLQVTPVDLKDLEAKYDMTFYVSDEADGIQISIVYNASLYGKGTIRVLTDQYTNLIQALLREPDAKLASFTLRSGTADSFLPDPTKPLPRPFKVPVTRQFVEIARQFPDHAALIQDQEQMSYRSLEQWSGSMAAALQEEGVQAGDVVALSGSRSFFMIAAMIGIMRARATLLLVDPALPEARISLMLKEANAAWFLDGGKDAFASMGESVRWIDLSSLKPDTDPQSEDLVDPDPASPAYVFFTSGTTGIPKGILGNHKGLSHFIDWERGILEVNEIDRVAQLTGYSFDVILRDVFLPLTSGAALCLPPEAVSAQGGDAVQWIQKAGVSIVHTVPSVVETWLNEDEARFELPSLRYALIAGEPLKGGLVKRWRRRFGAGTRLINLYGATETTLAKTWYAIPVEPHPGVQPIGRPMPETQVLILGTGDRPCGVREPGQIAIRTPFMSSGYINGSEADRARFIPNPFRDDPTDLVYLSGDIGYIDQAGLLRILGRMDDQIKLNGVRIEPAEVVAQLEQHPAVGQAVVTVQESQDGERSLVAYVVSAGTGATLSVPELREYLRGLIPGYLVPGAIVLLEKLPLTANGKVDRKALPVPDPNRSLGDASFDPPRTPTEEAIADIWKSILNLEAVGRRDNFFDLGGHSLLATRVIARMRRHLSGDIPLRSIFEHPTIESLARAIGGEQPEPDDDLGHASADQGQGEKVLPVSFSQRRVWFLDRLEGGSLEYHMPEVMRLRGKLDVAALEKALNVAVARHESLRTAFREVDDQPHQVILSNLAVSLAVLDLSTQDAATRQEALDDEIQRTCKTPFDLRVAPLLRARLIRLSADEHVLITVLHHIISDGWSVGIFRRELSALYAAFRDGRENPLQPLRTQYGDYTLWQRKHLDGKNLEKLEHFWLKTMQGYAPVLDLPTDRPRREGGSKETGRSAIVLPLALCDDLKQTFREARATLFMGLLAAFKVVLARISGQDDVIVGTPVAGRNHEHLEDLIGFFIGTVPLRTDLSGNPVFRELLEREKQGILDAFEHQDLPFEKLVELLHPERTRLYSPVFQVFFNLINLQRSASSFAGLEVENLPIPPNDAKFDLTLYVYESDEGLNLRAVYNAALYDQKTNDRWLQQYRVLLEQIVKDPAVRIRGYSLLDDKLRASLPDPQVPLSGKPHPSLIDLFSEQVQRVPDRTALVDSFGEVSYSELDRTSTLLASQLNQQGVKQGDIVAVYASPCASLVAALLGVLKGGAAFHVLDSAHPGERLRKQLLQSRPSANICLEESGGVPGWLSETSLDTGWAGPVSFSIRNQPPVLMEIEAGTPVSADGTAYVAFTSGSTGEPVGILGTHAPVSHFIAWQSRTFDLSEKDRFSLLSGLGHDPLLRDVFTPLSLGATLHIPDAGVRGDAARLMRWLMDQSVTVVHATPSLAGLIGEASDYLSLKLDRLRKLFLGGEKLTTETARKVLNAAPDCRIVNLYGASETPQGMGYYQVEAADLDNAVSTRSLPIGRGIDDVQLLVLSDAKTLCAPGELGEICVRTPYLSQGYLGEEEMTRAKFPDNPFTGKEGDRIYRTGDLGRYRADGVVEYVARKDRQVKVRGFRVELAEIEMLINSFEGIRQCAVVLREDNPGHPQLVAYLVPVAGSSPPGWDALRQELRSRLPDYMVPAAGVFLENIPLTPNGKLHVSALPKPEADPHRSTGKFVEPGTAVEKLIAGIWSELLGIERVGRYDNFFELGGHSLIANQVVARVCRAEGVEIPLKALFEHPTLDTFSSAVEALASGSMMEITPIEGERYGEALPVSFAQQRLWFLDKFKGSSSEYNMGAALMLEGQLDVEALQKAYQALVDRHESLRTRFIEQAGEPFQVVESSLHAKLEIEDLTVNGDEPGKERIRTIVSEFRSRAFDLKQAPLIRLKLIRLGNDRHLFLRNIHHIVSDGWSNGILNRELSDLYAAFAAGREFPLKPLPIQYPDYAAWQREWLKGPRLEQQVLYWRDQLKAAPTLDLPTDNPRPSRQTYNGARRTFELPEALVRHLGAFNQQEQVTPFMTFCAAFQAVLSRYSGQTDLTIGTPVANRRHVDVENLIGFFVNTLPIRVDLSGSPDFRRLVRRVKQVALDAYAHQDLPFEKMVEVLNPERDMSRHPIFQVVFAVQNTPAGTDLFPGLEASPYSLPTTTTHFDLEFHMWPRGGQWICTILYNTDLFHAATIERLEAHFINLLAACLNHPDTSVNEVDMLAPDERHQLLVEWNPPAIPYPRNACIHDVFREQAARDPGAVALVLDERHLTYGELDAWSDRVALRLIQGGTRPGSRIGVCLERSPELVVAFLGILKAGCAYVPLARDYPVERLKFMVEDAGLRTVIADADCPEALQGNSVQVLDCREMAMTTGPETPSFPRIEVSATDAAYVIYTSGSTGRPKGTVIPHRGVVRLVKGQKYADFGPEQRFLLLASPSFDASTFEIWAPLLNGGSAAIYQERFLDPPVLEEILRKHGVTCLWLTTGLFNLIVDTAPGMLGLVRHVLTGGELLSTGHVEKARALHPGLRLTNCYGPTECTTFATFNELCNGEGEPISASIGKPISHTQAYILDAARQPVPVGVAGELYLGGDGLSTGYLNQPELTRERFVPNPFSKNPEDLLYRTGDICRHLPDGRIDFIGRADNQVKVRGFRVETGEIESALNQHPSIAKGAIRVTRDSSGVVNLVAYFVSRTDRPEPAKSEIKAFLSARLPDYAVPSIFESVPDFPLTPNGKVDFAALPKPGSGQQDAHEATDRRGDLPVESALIGLWEKLFQRKGIQRNDNFFNLGGHSLMAARLASEIESHFGKSIPIAVLFEAPTVEELAARLAGVEEPERPQCLVTLQPDGSKVPLFCIHGWGGEVFGFLDLARHLAPERPVFGLQAIGLDGKVPRHGSVEEMAACYAEAIMERRPEGPVHLIGYSAGGWIAYAVAQELQQHGRRVNLSMLDTGMSSKVPYWIYALTKTVHLIGRLPYHFRHWSRLSGSDKLSYLGDRLRWLRVNVLRDTSKMPPVRSGSGEGIPQQGGERKAAPPPEVDYFIARAGEYRPKPYLGDLTLFAAKGSRWYSRFFWKFMIRGCVNIHYVDGGHHGLIDKHHVGNFSILFKEVLDRFDRK